MRDRIVLTTVVALGLSCPALAGCPGAKPSSGAGSARSAWGDVIEASAALAERRIDSGRTAMAAFAQEGAEPGPAAATEPWRLDVQPYIWIPAVIDGTSTVSGSTADLDLTFSDIWDNFDEVFALTGRFEAWRGDWGIIVDGMYVTIGGEFDVDLPGPGPDVTDIDVDVDQAIADIALGWRVVDRPLREGDGDGPRLFVDLIGGGRYQYLKQEIRLPPTTLGTSKDWMELLVQARIGLQLNDTVTVAVRADASGFGIGSASDLTWNLLAGVNLTLSPKFDLKLGYRMLDIDYDNGSGVDEFGLDVTMHGPYLGGSIRF
ncbi:MAG: porin family protein [Planctomycetota bacterium]|jgi:hypothetical protein